MKFHCFIILAIACVTYGAPTCKFGFIKRNTTGAVDTDKVYKAHFEQFSSVDVFTADRLQVSVSCDFQYFLREDELTLLHKKYGLYYEPILRSNAMHALKGAATKFAFREYITDRKRIEKALFEAVRERLGGNCCIPGCGKKGTCRPGCKSQADCTDADRGLYADVRYFQLTKVHIPDELIQRYLQALILQEDTETEKLRQEAHIICKETEAEVFQLVRDAGAQKVNTVSFLKSTAKQVHVIQFRHVSLIHHALRASLMEAVLQMAPAPLVTLALKILAAKPVKECFILSLWGDVARSVQSLIIAVMACAALHIVANSDKLEISVFEKQPKTLYRLKIPNWYRTV